jgi:hypothetical protein
LREGTCVPGRVPIGALRHAGAAGQLAALLARNPAAHVDLTNPLEVSALIGALRHAGAAEQLAALLARNPAAHVDLPPGAGSKLISALRDADAEKYALQLALCAADAGHEWAFDTFIELNADPQAADQPRPQHSS